MHSPCLIPLRSIIKSFIYCFQHTIVINVNTKIPTVHQISLCLLKFPKSSNKLNFLIPDVTEISLSCLYVLDLVMTMSHTNWAPKKHDWFDSNAHDRIIWLFHFSSEFWNLLKQEPSQKWVCSECCLTQSFLHLSLIFGASQSKPVVKIESKWLFPKQKLYVHKTSYWSVLCFSGNLYGSVRINIYTSMSV